MPPFQFDDEETFDENSRNAAIVTESDAPEGIHVEDTKRIDGQWRVAGESGFVLVVTGIGETMREAQQQVDIRVDDLIVPNLYYRDDVGERWIESDGDRSQSRGYLGP